MDKLDRILGIYRAFISPLTFLVGVLGNFLIILVFGVLQNRARCRFNIYVICISVANITDLICSTLIDDFMGRGLNFLIEKEYRLDEYSELVCKGLTFLRYLSSFIAANIFVLFSLDRLTTIYSPIKARGDLHLRKTWILLAIVYILPILLFSPHFIYTGLDPNKNNKCKYVDSIKSGSRYLILLYSFGTLIIPTMLMLVINLIIGFKIRRIAEKQNSMRKLNGTNDKRAINEFKRIIGHLAASSAFVLFSAPLVTAILIRSHLEVNHLQESSLYETVKSLTKLFSSFKSIYYALEFFIFITFMPNFRTQLAEIFFGNVCCLKSRLGQWALRGMDKRTRRSLEEKIQRKKHVYSFVNSSKSAKSSINSVLKPCKTLKNENSSFSIEYDIKNCQDDQPNIIVSER